MMRVARTSFPARLGAVLVAVALTGAPALAAHPQSGEHRCECKAGGRHHECECALCREKSCKPRRAPAAKAPCHGAGAAVAKDTAEPAARPWTPAGPCMTGRCGAPERHGAALTPLDAFTLPLAQGPPGALPPAGDVERPSGDQRETSCVPETPPPRAARAPAVRA